MKIIIIIRIPQLSTYFLHLNTINCLFKYTNKLYYAHNIVMNMYSNTQDIKYFKIFWYKTVL